MTSPLLPLRGRFLEQLGAASQLAWSLFHGRHTQLALTGAPAEFEGHRGYLPGDDTRWIDWNLYARLEELHVKVFSVEEEVELLILVDASPSMTGGAGLKYRTAAAAAAATAYLGLLNAHAVTVVRYAGGVLDIDGPHRPLESYTAIVRRLLSPAAGKGTDLRASLEPLLHRLRRPLTVIVASDGFQEAPLEQAAIAARDGARRRVTWLRILDPADIAPRLRGQLLLADAETDRTRLLLTDRDLETRLHARIAAHFEALSRTLRNAGVEVFEVPLGQPFEESYLRLLHAARAADGAAARV